MDIAERLQELRKKTGYSQEQIADMLEISRQAVSKWESGQGKPEIDNIIKLTHIYNVSTDYILLGTENKMVVPTLEKKNFPKEYRQAIMIILVVATSAITAVLFFAALGLLAKYGLA